MTKAQTWLSGLLAAQLLLGAILFWGGRPDQTAQSQAFLSFEPPQIDKIVVGDGKQSVTLNRSADAWLIAELDKLPADANKLDAQLKRLSGLKTGWPVATTSGSHERFEVADGKFQRKLQFYRGDRLAGELLIGSTPGFKKSHVRKPGDTAVYAVEINQFDWPANPADWLDKSLLAAKEIETIKGPDYAIRKQGQTWQFDSAQASASTDQGASEQLNPVKAMELSMALSGLRVASQLDKIPEGAGKSVELQVGGPKGTWRYQFNRVGDGYFVRRDDRDQLFGISQLDFDRIAGVDKVQLTLSAKPSGESPAITETTANRP